VTIIKHFIINEDPEALISQIIISGSLLVYIFSVKCWKNEQKG